MLVRSNVLDESQKESRCIMRVNTHSGLKRVKKPRVSVGICVKNGGKYIGEAIASILEQDFPHALMEIIFVDDGSEDNTLSVIDSFVLKMDMPVEVVRQSWKGLGASRNVVVNSANGEYIVWVDSDMRLPKDFVRRQVEFMDGNLDVGIGKGRYEMNNASSLVSFLENIEAIAEFHNHEQKSISKPMGTGGSIYRVETIREVGGFDDNIRGVGEDMDAELRIRRAGWLLRITSATFYEERRKNWKTLWDEYLWHGSAGQVVLHKMKTHGGVLYRMFPPVAILTEVSRSCAAYRLVHRRAVFLLPLHWIFKRIAWCIGFAMNYLK